MALRWENVYVVLLTWYLRNSEIVCCFISAVFSVTIKLVSPRKTYRPSASRSLEAVGSNPTQGTGSYLLSIHEFVFISQCRRIVVICQICIEKVFQNVHKNAEVKGNKFINVGCTCLTCHKNEIVMNSPWSWILLEKPSVAHLRKTSPNVSKNLKFQITFFTTAFHLFLSWARWIQSIPPHIISFKSILKLSSH